ncbi:MAG TPA: hypothetical protein VF586_07280 [Pyrinomonadaceae bacterium]|jgi:hypothetical protein
MFAKKGLYALPLLLLFTLAGGASGQTTRTYSLTQGDTLTPASPFVDEAGATTYHGALVIGQVSGATPGTFTFSLAFRETGLIDAAAGVYAGVILPPTSSFSVSEVSGRKSVSTSGTVDSGAVTYRLTPDGRADIISVVSSGLTVWEGRNKTRRAVGHGAVDYGTAAEGAGTLVLYF